MSRKVVLEEENDEEAGEDTSRVDDKAEEASNTVFTMFGEVANSKLRDEKGMLDGVTSTVVLEGGEQTSVVNVATLDVVAGADVTGDEEPEIRTMPFGYSQNRSLTTNVVIGPSTIISVLQ